MRSCRYDAVLAKCVGLVALLLSTHGAVAVVPPSWKSTLYLVPEGDTSLTEVFSNFQRLINVSVELTPGVKGPTASQGQPLTVEALLDSLANRHGLTWFVFRDHLYVSRQSEAREVRLKVVASRMEELRSYLAGIKLLDERFVWVELASRDEVMVQGPPAYIELVRDNASSLKPADPPAPPPQPPIEMPQVMTFRLRYASASDDAMGRLGVATLLARLYGGVGAGSLPPSVRSLIDPSALRVNRAVDSSAAGNTLQSAQAAMVSALNRPTLGAADPMAAAPGAMPRRLEDMPTFEADPRLNMVIVRDKPSRRPEYERVIAALDVVTEQIALDATVIELPVNSMRDALAAISSNAAVAASASGMPALVATRALVERAFEQVSRARKKDGSVAILTQGIVFSEDNPFTLDFADSRTLPQNSTTIWETLARSVIPMKVDNGDTERRIGLKLSGSAKFVNGRGINLKLDLAEERNTPHPAAKVTSGRSTSVGMSVDVREDQILVLVNSSVWSGEDMSEPRGRAILLSTQRWQSKVTPLVVDASAPAAAAAPTSMPIPPSPATGSGVTAMSQGHGSSPSSLARHGP